MKLTTEDRARIRANQLRAMKPERIKVNIAAQAASDEYRMKLLPAAYRAARTEELSRAPFGEIGGVS